MQQSKATLYALTNLIAAGTVLLGGAGILFVMATSLIHPDPASGHTLRFCFTSFRKAGTPIYQYLTPLCMKLTGLSGLLFAVGMIALLLNALVNGKLKNLHHWGSSRSRQDDKFQLASSASRLV
jgi:hypothetical protein